MELESDYPKSIKENKCNYNKSKVNAKVDKIQSIAPKSMLKLKEAIASTPVIVLVSGNSQVF